MRPAIERGQAEGTIRPFDPALLDYAVLSLGGTAAAFADEIETVTGRRVRDEHGAAELVALYWMHGIENAWHAFLRLHDHASIAFVQTPEIAKIEATIGVTHAANLATPSVAGSMQHLALNVDDEAELLALRDRIRSRGVNVFGPIDHGFCRSIYFAGPEQLSLEISTSAAAIDADAWIDPEVVALAGISSDELARCRSRPTTRRSRTWSIRRRRTRRCSRCPMRSSRA